LLIGEWHEVALSVGTAIAGAILLGIGVVGYLFRPIGLLKRILFLLSAIALLIPVLGSGSFAALTWTVNGVGLALAVLLVGTEILARRARTAGAIPIERAKAPLG
jgi:TRAP-type uncharacterized transport system fused permease subunit